MARKKAKDREGEIFRSIRKPTAPPTRKIGENAPEEKHKPSLRKTKHKRPPEIEE